MAARIQISPPPAVAQRQFDERLDQQMALSPPIGAPLSITLIKTGLDRTPKAKIINYQNSTG